MNENQESNHNHEWESNYEFNYEQESNLNLELHIYWKSPRPAKGRFPLHAQDHLLPLLHPKKKWVYESFGVF